VDNVDHKIRTPYLASVSLVDSQNRIFCSGTIIKNKKHEKLIVLLANHCVDDGKDVFITTAYDNKLRLMEVKKSNTKNDLALLKSVLKEDHDGPYVRLARNEPEIGDHIWAIGNPSGNERIVSDGVIAKWEIEDKVKYYRYTAPTYFGSSGGGVFDDHGRLVGVVDMLEYAYLPIIMDVGGMGIDVPNLYAPSVKPGSFIAISLPEIVSFLK
jgi:S1-C subfamily serine protease